MSKQRKYYPKPEPGQPRAKSKLPRRHVFTGKGVKLFNAEYAIMANGEWRRNKG